MNLKLLLFSLVVSLPIFYAWSQQAELSTAEKAYIQGDFVTAANEYTIMASAESSADYFYQAARSWARSGSKEQSLKMLDSAFQYGYGNPAKVRVDPAFSWIANSSEFKAIIQKEVEFETDKEISMTDILLALKDRKVVRIYDATIVNEFDAFYAGPYDVTLPLSVPDLKTLPLTPDSLFDFADRSLHFINCKGNIHLEGLRLRELEIATNEDLNSDRQQRGFSDWDVVALYNLELDNFRYDLMGYQFVRFQSVTAHKIPVYSITNAQIFDIINCQLTLDFTYFDGGYVPYYSIGTKDEKIDNIHILSSEFKTSQDTNANFGFVIPLELHGTVLTMENNTFHDELTFLASSWDGIKMIGNEFKQPVDFSNAFFPEFNNYLPFNQFVEGLGIAQGRNRPWDQMKEKYLVTGTYDEIKDEVAFDQLVNSYQFLYSNYRLRGEIYSANSAYVKMKDIILNREKYLNDRDPSFTRYLRYQIGLLLKYYTDHGTNPAKAIKISIYIILLFSVLYVFFPSEWDASSSSRLVDAWSEIRRKNTDNSFRKIIHFLKRLMISWLNALTLSLNAFVTLGFGAVPTTGVARYLCVLQGFVGWFLLSIFTVALINQVLQ